MGRTGVSVRRGVGRVGADSTFVPFLTALVVETAGAVVRSGGRSAGRVTLPERLKFWSSLGPIVSAGCALFVGGPASCARAATGASRRPAVNATLAKRQAPLICSRLKIVNRAIFPRRDGHMPAERLAFKHRQDEPARNLDA